MRFPRIRWPFHSTSTSKVSPADFADVAPGNVRTKKSENQAGRKSDQKQDQALPGAVPLLEDDTHQASPTPKTKSDRRNGRNDDPNVTILASGGVPTPAKVTIDKAILKDGVLDESRGESKTVKAVGMGTFGLPSDHSWKAPLLAILDEPPPTKSNLLRPSEMQLEKEIEIDRRHWRAFDGRWKLEDDTINVPKHYHELFFLQGHVADGKDRVKRLEKIRKRILWAGRQVELSEDADELIIVNSYGYRVRYVRACGSCYNGACVADVTDE